MHDASGSKFWKSFGLDRAPDVRGKRVLEIGCGRGLRCLEFANEGAATVVGLDLDAERLEVAKSRFDENAATTGCDIRTHLGPLDTLEEGDFDIIVSENAFEHIMNVAEVLRDIDARLSPSGRVYVGFAPLYHSPFGDHGWERKVLPFRRYFSWPWGHLIFPTSYTLRRLSDLHGRPVDFEDGWPYLTLNRHTPDEFLEMFNSGPLKVVSLVINPAFSLKGRVFGLLARLPFGRKYFVWGMNVILGRKVA